MPRAAVSNHCSKSRPLQRLAEDKANWSLQVVQVDSDSVISEVYEQAKHDGEQAKTTTNTHSDIYAITVSAKSNRYCTYTR